MANPDEPEPESIPLAQQLGENFASLVGSQEWQLDGMDALEGFVPEAEVPLAEAVDVPAVIPLAEAVEEPPPPLAEAVTESTVPPSPLQIIEALLFVGGLPLKPEHVSEVIRGLPADDVAEYVDVLNRVYKTQNRPYHIVRRPTGFVMQLRPKYAGLHEKMFGGPREARLNQPALDVLSLVAYRQPIGKSELDTIRGQDSAGVVRQLVRLGLVAVAERATGERETLYGTTERFLEIFKLKSLEDLPVVGEAKKVI
ncbi:SMC-Scp complex subunit ScpB [Zavarzinella formosa]|uniref:SMC-Scp complex subunit ScpB n=1 Tax=Zavarzinella formosa TaxID=360055 RepID=UPI0002FC90D1|nr:SMC-Scp complex subunit ScpB [Zavarzinella formosa]